MAATTQFTIGTEAICRDGVAGKLSRVVVDPVAREVTHLVVEPKLDTGRLVPLSLVTVTADGISLDCTLEEFGKLDAAEETHFLDGTTPFGDYEAGQVLTWPFYGLAVSDGPLGVGGLGSGEIWQTVTTDTLPVGEVAVRRGEQVHATDGNIGRVQGLVIDTRNHHVTHVLLQEGHLWGRKEVAIPISAVTGVADGIQLNVSKQQVQDLPPVDLEHAAG